MTQCCGPTHCAADLETYVCQALKLLPDFSGKLNPDGNYVKFITAMIQSFYECVVQSSCAIEKEFSPCQSELYFEQWAEEFALPFRCPLEGISDELEQELLRLQICIQNRLISGAVFNQDLLDQIADTLGITYDVAVPTYDLSNVSPCDVIPMISSGGQGCVPGGCAFIQAFIIRVTCAPSDAHIRVFECFISELTPCHVRHCVVDDTPSSELLAPTCTDQIDADCLLNSELQSATCTDEIEI